MAQIPERYLPVATVLQQIIEENFPDLSSGPGSAIHSTLVLPAALMFQRFRDTMRVLQRNQSLRNYSVMLPEELTRLASNYLVSPKGPTRASGLQRVVFSNVQDVVIDERAVFTSQTGQTYRPITTTRLSSVDLAANSLANGREYYVDINILADLPGTGAAASAGTINQVSGIVGAARTFNVQDFNGGDNQESNSELYARILKSLTNRDLVKKDAISAALMAAFPQIRTVSVQGYGDPYMTRDVITVTTGTQPLLTGSFCQKVNLPLDINGKVLYAEDADSTAVGGFVGAIYDLTGLDYDAVVVSLSANETKTIPIQEGYKVRFLSPTDPDYSQNDLIVAKIESVPVEPGGDPVQILRLNKTLNNTAEVGDVEDTPYTILGLTVNDSFHVGGKVDVYFTSLNEIKSEVIINQLPAREEDSDEAYVPLSGQFVDEAGLSFFENQIGFAYPVLFIDKIELVDAANENIILQELVPGEHYFLVRSSGSFLTDTLVIRGEQEDIDVDTGLPTGDVIPLFIGQRLRITYTTNPDYAAVSVYVQNDTVRDITKDIKVQIPTFSKLDVSLTYTGTMSPSDISARVTQFINDTDFGGSVTTSDLISLLSYYDVDKVHTPVKLTLHRSSPSGLVETTYSEDGITALPIELLRSSNIEIIQK